jgi:hypothetical protein
MGFWEKIKTWKDKITLISGFVILLTGVGIVPITKQVINFVNFQSYIIKDYPILRVEVDSLKLRIKLIEKKLEDYDLIKEHVIYLMKDNDILGGILRATMKKIDDKDYGTVVHMYNFQKKEYCRQLVEVKIRQAITSGDLYVFVPWGETEFGTPISKKFSIKWHEDEEKYYFIDKKGDFYLLYEIDISKTIRI